MKFLTLPTLFLVCVLALTACNKPQESATELAKIETQTQASTLSLDSSPTLEVMTHSLKIEVWGIIQATTPNLNLSDEQIACLVDYDKASFNEPAKALTLKWFDDELLKRSDDFYASEVGQELLAMTVQAKLDNRGDVVVNEQAVELTADDQAKVAEFSQSVTDAKLKGEATDGDMETWKVLMMELAEKEKTRCQIQ